MRWGQAPADALHVGRVEVPAGVGQPRARERVRSPWHRWPGRRDPTGRSRRAHHAGRPAAASRRTKSPASNRSAPRRWRTGHGERDGGAQVLLVDPLEGSAGTPSKGLPRTRARASVRSARAASRPTVSASPIEPLEDGPVRVHPVDQIAAGDGSIREVLGADETAELGEVVVKRLAGGVGRDSPRPARRHLDLLGTAVVVVVQDEVHQELVDDPSIVALAESRDLDRPHDARPWGPPRAKGFATGSGGTTLDGGSVSSSGLGERWRNESGIGCRVGRWPVTLASDALHDDDRRRGDNNQDHDRQPDREPAASGVSPLVFPEEPAASPVAGKRGTDPRRLLLGRQSRSGRPGS